ncbi:hypothetical protein ACIHCX_16740 [Streptomyces sp. NPDC052043]|uniref:hypothetical protein n=1 Tax=Streptomyces sp. NPDC052043 TaxID=3365684 RepID=UPI0037D9652D
MQAEPSDVQDGSVGAVDPAERQPLLGSLQSADSMRQTLCGDIARVDLARAVGRRPQHIRQLGPCIRQSLIEQPVHSGHVGLLHLDLSCGTLIELGQKQPSLDSALHYAAKSL